MKYLSTENLNFLCIRRYFFFILSVATAFCMIIIEITLKKRNFWNFYPRDPILSSNEAIWVLLLRWKNQHDSCTRSKVTFFYVKVLLILRHFWRKNNIGKVPLKSLLGKRIKILYFWMQIPFLHQILAQIHV